MISNTKSRLKPSVSMYRGDTWRYSLPYSPRYVAEAMRGYSTGTLLLDKLIGTTETDRLIAKYCIGSSSSGTGRSNGSAIFWQLNTAGRIVNGYSVNFDEAGKEISRQQLDTLYGLYTWSNWFFGGHLITATKMIGVVDNEITCLVAASVCKEVTWIAANNLQVDVLNLVKYGGKDIVLYPSDLSHEYWQEIGRKCYVPVSDALAVPDPARKLLDG